MYSCGIKIIPAVNWGWFQKIPYVSPRVLEEQAGHWQTERLNKTSKTRRKTGSKKSEREEEQVPRTPGVGTE